MNKLTIITGSPASGKTTFGKKLAAKENAVFLDIDSVTETIIKVSMKELSGDENDRDSQTFKSLFRNPIYETLFKIAKENLYINSVVITGPFTKELRDFNWPDKLKAEIWPNISIYYVYCKPRVRYNRLIQRNNSRDISKLKDWKAFNKYYGSELPPEFKHIFIDNSIENEELFSK